ncbi:putative Thaumatin family [Helianthus annuus]|nr:putative Thaumatin family [Helianthus annuus]
MAKLQFSITLLSLSLISTFNSIQSAATFTLTNQCTYSVWAGLLSGAGTPPLPTTGFPLEPSQSNSISIPPSWSGRIWGRTLCSTDSTGRFTCVTGDCGSGTVECNGSGAAPPATLAEFTLNGANGMDFYDVSLVDGYNLPMMVVPQGESGGNCNVTGCMADLNKNCPAELRLTGAGDDGESVACRSACEAFGDPMYCCSGAYSTPQTCNPTSFSEYFKTACPTAYSYAYDDGTSTFTCSSSPNYVITFCPTPANRYI